MAAHDDTFLLSSWVKLPLLGKHNSVRHYPLVTDVIDVNKTSTIQWQHVTSFICKERSVEPSMLFWWQIDERNLISDFFCYLLKMNKLLLCHVCRRWSLSWRSRIWRCQIQRATIWRKRLFAESLRREENRSVSLSFCLSLVYTGSSFINPISIRISVSFSERLWTTPPPRYGCGPRPSLWTANFWWKRFTSSIRLSRVKTM